MTRATGYDARERWLAAVCYLGPLVLWPLLTERRKSPFLARHCQQGFALLFAEFIAWLLLILLDTTIGKIPVLGFIVSLVLHLLVGLVALVLSILGFVRGLSGESWHMQILDDLADRIPVTANVPEAQEPRE